MQEVVQFAYGISLCHQVNTEQHLFLGFAPLLTIFLHWSPELPLCDGGPCGPPEPPWSPWRLRQCPRCPRCSSPPPLGSMTLGPAGGPEACRLRDVPFTSPLVCPITKLYRNLLHKLSVRLFNIFVAFDELRSREPFCYSIDGCTVCGIMSFFWRIAWDSRACSFSIDTSHKPRRFGSTIDHSAT